MFGAWGKSWAKAWGSAWGALGSQDRRRVRVTVKEGLALPLQVSEYHLRYISAVAHDAWLLGGGDIPNSRTFQAGPPILWMAEDRKGSVLETGEALWFRLDASQRQSTLISASDKPARLTSAYQAIIRASDAAYHPLCTFAQPRINFAARDALSRTVGLADQ
jgi:hypothetical protein